MAHQPTKLEKDIKQRAKALAGRGQKQRLEWMQLYPIGLELEATVAIGKLAWSKLQMSGTKWRRSAQRDLLLMTAQQREWSRLWADLQTFRRKLAATWRQPGSMSNWSEVRERLEMEASNRGLTPQQITQRVAAFEHASADDVCRVNERPVVWFGRQLDATVVGRFSALAAADIADAVARFNTTVKKGTVKKPTSMLGRKSQDEAIARLQGIHGALKTGKPSAILAKAKVARVSATKLLGPLLDAAAYDALHDGAGIDVDLGRHALEIAGGIRAVLTTLSAVRNVEWVAGWPESSPLFVRWTSAANATSFGTRLPDIDSTSLSDVVGAPAQFDGKRIRVEGKVGPIAIVHRHQKAISSTSLTDASGTQIRIGLPYIKIDSGGLVMGSYARVTGTYSISHADFNTPVLVPDRRNLTEDARTSWLDWLALEIQPYYWSVPHGLVIESSWSPGREGPGNSLRYHVWASNERRRIHVD